MQINRQYLKYFNKHFYLLMKLTLVLILYLLF